MHSSVLILFFFFFNDTATTEIYTLSLHDALPIWETSTGSGCGRRCTCARTSSTTSSTRTSTRSPRSTIWRSAFAASRSEEHTSELQSLAYLVCRLLLEKKKNKKEYYEAYV